MGVRDAEAGTAGEGDDVGFDFADVVDEEAVAEGGGDVGAESEQRVIVADACLLHVEVGQQVIRRIDAPNTQGERTPGDRLNLDTHVSRPGLHERGRGNRRQNDVAGEPVELEGADPDHGDWALASASAIDAVMIALGSGCRGCVLAAVC